MTFAHFKTHISLTSMLITASLNILIQNDQISEYESGKVNAKDSPQEINIQRYCIPGMLDVAFFPL